MGPLAASVTFRGDAQQFQDFPEEDRAGYNRKNKVREPGTPGERSRPSWHPHQPYLVPFIVPPMDTGILQTQSVHRWASLGRPEVLSWFFLLITLSSYTNHIPSMGLSFLKKKMKRLAQISALQTPLCRIT